MYYSQLSDDEKIEVVTLLINEFIYDLDLFQLVELDEVLGTQGLMIEKIVVDKRIVSLALYTIDTIENRKWTYIEYICTKAGYKNQGYATALLNKLPQPIYLHVVKSEHSAKLLSWYTRNNFTILRETPSRRSYLLLNQEIEQQQNKIKQQKNKIEQPKGEWEL